LHHAEALATWYDADLHVLHSFLDLVPAMVPVPAYGASPVDARTEATATLREFVRQSRVGIPIREVVREGDPVPTILSYADYVAADLIVMGTHGLTGLERALVGSTAERVLHEASCPVLTIPKSGDEPGSASHVRFTHVLCAVDFSPSSQKAFTHGLSLAEENNAKLTLVHVLGMLSDEDARTAAHFRVAEYVRARRHDTLEQLKALVPPEAREWCEITEIVELGSPAQTIVRLTDQLGADLLVMGAQGRGGLGLALFGSTTQTVVRRIGCPVLTVHA
jgi:nucleotide-binding universal stress UspA family protein